MPIWFGLVFERKLFSKLSKFFYTSQIEKGLDVFFLNKKPKKSRSFQSKVF